ncbi:MAG: TaqI family restriction endonuclease [Thermoplasmata archaeon]
MVSKRDILKNFEDFLTSIPLDNYREELLAVKTVEQDLPRDLNPIPYIYEIYWVENDSINAFPNYDEFFNNWWENHLRALDIFIKQYFWGCSYDFVRLGFKARLYRTLISVLTQFHFCYLWKTVCNLPLNASADLDMSGTDALISYGGKNVGIQIKKQTHRPEARSGGRFSQKKQQHDLIIEVPYTIDRPEQWEGRVKRARKKENIEMMVLFSFLSSKLQKWLPNGFVVFTEEYLINIEKLIKDLVNRDKKEVIGWDKLLNELLLFNNKS